MVRRMLAAALVAAVVTGAAGCSSTQQAVKQTVEQGVEPTSTGPHNVAPANAAQNAVDKANDAVQQTQQGAAALGQ